jgi:DNA-directed RNA polymerase subunit beta'
MIDTKEFAKLTLKIASPEVIRDEWSHGEITLPETVNFRTHLPDEKGLFSQKIFGPIKDYECACGRYKRVRFKGIVCEKCGVEVAKSNVRKERLGHITLETPICHVWFLKNLPSRLSNVLGFNPRELDKLVYYTCYLVTKVDTESIHQDREVLEAEMKQMISGQEAIYEETVAKRTAQYEKDVETLTNNKKNPNESLKKLKNALDREIKRLGENKETKKVDLQNQFDKLISLKKGDFLEYDSGFQVLSSLYDKYFEAHIGAEAIYKWFEGMEDDFLEEAGGDSEKDRDKAMNLALRQQKIDLTERMNAEKCPVSEKEKIVKRVSIINSFVKSGQNPKNMIITQLPVIPPDLRPMIELESNRLTTSDLNELYRKIIMRNNRLKKLKQQQVPEIIINYEKRDLQESIDALFDSSRKSKSATNVTRKPQKSIADSLKGKRGRFRQNLLGKRVDYSGRSVIVVGPSLKIYQCGLPKQMALELFKPYIIAKLMKNNIVSNIRMARYYVDSEQDVVWDFLEEVIKSHPVLLNRAPTLHRLGIQAFEPILVEGKAIQLHPLACAAFNADFDGDQMAVHVPLSLQAQAEARILMASNNNILKPADGKPITLPSQDMIVGIYSLTEIEPIDKKQPIRTFSEVGEVELANDNKTISLNTPVRVLKNVIPAKYDWQTSDIKDDINGAVLTTTYGRLLFNEITPDDYPYLNLLLDKKGLSKLVDDMTKKYSTYDVDIFLDKLKDLGFKFATQSGMSIAFSDVIQPKDKQKTIDKYEAEAIKINELFEIDAITDEDRKAKLVEIWTKAADEVGEGMEEEFKKHPENTVYQMVSSGARGNMMQVRQIAAMRGLVAGPTGEIIPRPIKSNYREGLSGLEYFIASHGARKGLADTALKTADSGYLTRRLVDISQDVIVREIECGTKQSEIIAIADDPKAKVLKPSPIVDTTALTRVLASDVKKGSKVLFKAGTPVKANVVEDCLEAGISELDLRSVKYCNAKVGICANCYGLSMSSGKLVDLGEAVGIIAAQSIGEPGTQLTLRTFHSGGAASADDITQGLPRVSELFESRRPKGEAYLSELTGKVEIEEQPDSRNITVTSTTDKENEVRFYKISATSKLKVKNGDTIEAGTPFTEGSFWPKDVLRINGKAAAQQYVVDGVQEVYRSQGVDLHDKHIELIVRQMTTKVMVIDAGDSPFAIGEYIDSVRFADANAILDKEGKTPAIARNEMLGITRAALQTYSWLSAASFQETSRVLTQAAIESKSDSLIGVKENVIIGRTIPAGTGISDYDFIGPDIDDEVAQLKYPNLYKAHEDFITAEDIDAISAGEKEIDIDELISSAGF